MAHHEKGQADCLSFFVARYPSEVVTRQPVAVDRQFAARQILAEGLPLAGNGNIPKTRNVKAWQIACPFSWRVIREKSLRGNLLPSIVNLPQGKFLPRGSRLRETAIFRKLEM